MRIHHLNCGTMCPVGLGSLLCHCLLVEGKDGLMLVDTGFGTADVATPRLRLGRSQMWLVRPRLDQNETALAQVHALGATAGDVRDIVVTHLDADHAGGLSDFPHARVHLLGSELDGVRTPSLREKLRYRSAQWAHEPRWVAHEVRGERWFGFDSVRAVAENDEVLLIPLLGHSRGHAGVAVRDGAGWLLHAGDAYYRQGELEDPPQCPRTVSMFERVIAVDNAARRANQTRLRELVRERGHEVRVFSAHDPAGIAQNQHLATPVAGR